MAPGPLAGGEAADKKDDPTSALLKSADPEAAQAASDATANDEAFVAAQQQLWTDRIAQAELAKDESVVVELLREWLKVGEFELLALLVRSGGRVVTRDQLIDAVSGTDRNPSDRTIDVLVSRLRRKMGDEGGSPRLIMTEKGLGYRLGVDIV